MPHRQQSNVLESFLQHLLDDSREDVNTDVSYLSNQCQPNLGQLFIGISSRGATLDVRIGIKLRKGSSIVNRIYRSRFKHR